MAEPFTYMAINGIPLPGIVTRKLKQSLAQINEGGGNERLVNGERISLARPQFRKWKTTISGNNSCPPALSRLFRGDIVTISCIAKIQEPGEVAVANLMRPAVAGSVRYFVTGATGLPRAVAAGTPGIEFTRYRPILRIMIDTAPEIDESEWEADVEWSITGEEV